MRIQYTASKVVGMRLKDETILSIGMLSMAIGLLVGRFLPVEYLGFSISGFVEGLLLGLSLVMNLFYLVKRSKKSLDQEFWPTLQAKK